MEEGGHAPSWVSKPKQKRRVLATATERISQRLLRRGATDVCPGFAAKGLWNRVFLPVFELPDEGYQGLFAGAHRKCFSLQTRLEEYAIPACLSEIPHCARASCLLLLLLSPWAVPHAREHGWRYMELIFDSHGAKELRLPPRCTLDLSGLEQPEVQEALTLCLQENLYIAASVGIDLTALDGVTFAVDCRKAACALQNLPAGALPLEVGSQPESMELARTAAVWRDDALRFHIVIRFGLGLMALSPDRDMQRLALACMAHEAAHVEHESHLYRTFPESYGKPLECGNRSRKAFLKAMDVWSEYAACRSSALFRPEAVAEFEAIVCRALDDCDGKTEQARTQNEERDEILIRRETEQIVGDVFICAGYLLGQMHGLGQWLTDPRPNLEDTFRRQPTFAASIRRLENVLVQMWSTKLSWDSIEVFAPIYDLICERADGSDSSMGTVT